MNNEKIEMPDVQWVITSSWHFPYVMNTIGENVPLVQYLPRHTPDIKEAKRFPSATEAAKVIQEIYKEQKELLHTRDMAYYPIPVSVEPVTEIKVIEETVTVEPLFEDLYND